MQIGHLRVVIMFFQPLQPLRVKDPGGTAGQRAAEKLGKQIILEVEDGCAVSLTKAVLQGRGCLKPGVVCIVQIGKGRGNAADNPQLFQHRAQSVYGLFFGLIHREKFRHGILKFKGKGARMPLLQSG